jgi:predicted TIM-barrel fold metal-dependent hydrolase
MDEFADYSEVLSLGLPPLEALAGPDQTPEFARVANDGLAQLCAKYPDRFAGYVGALPMNAPDAAAKEAERILIQGGANGLQLHTNVNGACLDEPRFFSDLRNRGQGGQAGAAASRADAQCSGFPCREKIEIRDLGDPGLAL